MCFSADKIKCQNLGFSVACEQLSRAVWGGALFMDCYSYTMLIKDINDLFALLSKMIGILPS